MRKKLMILGAGQCQVPIIKQAQEMLYETIAVSASGNYPGLSIADKSYHIDVREKEKILDIAIDENVNAILTDQTDISVPSVAYVAEQMGLPGIGYDCALRFTDKYIMRQYGQQLGIPVPKHLVASSLAEARDAAEKLGFPLVIKPVDNQGSRGVTKINSIETLEGKYRSAVENSPQHLVILEQFFPGIEVVVQGFVSNFKFTNLIIGDRKYFNLKDLFIPKQTIFPTKIEAPLKKKVLALNARLIKGFGPAFGITHSEFIVNPETGDIHLVETAIRGGGVFISSDLIPLTCGINTNKLLIKLACGESVRINADRILNNASAYLCFYLEEGIIRQVNGIDAVRSLSGVHKIYLDNIVPGRKTKAITDKTMRLGPILIAGKNRYACSKVIQEIQNTLHIEVETDRGIKGIVW